MRTREQRAADIASAWEALRERARKTLGVRETGDWGSGESFAVRRLGLGLDVLAYVELLDGELWLQLCVGRVDGEAVTLGELEWVRSTFTDDARALMIWPRSSERGAPTWPSLWVPLERCPLPTFP